jgi:hypothetical protein
MANLDNLLERAFLTIKETTTLPTRQQKDMMLDRILKECNSKKTSAFLKIRNMVITYPWRFAFTVSAVQTTVFTIVFGTKYTNLFFNFFGG